jgi:hypothetical protein
MAEPLARHLGEVREEIEKLSGDGPTGVHPVVVPTIMAPDRFGQYCASLVVGLAVVGFSGGIFGTGSPEWYAGCG